MMQDKRRNGAVDLMKFVFAVIIMMHHSRYVVGYDNCVFAGGSLGVEFFFIVSGYLLCHSAEKAVIAGKCEDRRTGIGTQTAQFLRHKIMGFLPEFMIAWLIGFVYICIYDQYQGEQIIKRFAECIYEVTLVQMSGLYGKGIDGVIWYLSAMILCMAILYPLLLKWYDMMTHIGAPLIALFVSGWLYQNFSHPRDPQVWTGLFYKGLLRCMAELCMGIVLYKIVQKYSRTEYTAFGKTVLTAAAIFCYAAVIRYMWLNKPSNDDYFYIILLLIAVGISFSHKGLGASLLDGRVTHNLAEYSLTLYLSHLYLSTHLKFLSVMGLSIRAQIAVYIVLSMLNGGLVLALSKLFRAHEKGIALWCRRLFAADKR